LGTLYLVATPIGNLEDVTLRALRVLKEAKVVAAEDTRTTRRLLSKYDIAPTELISYTEHNHRSRARVILRALEGGDVALVSEAGVPGVSDPGLHLVEEAVAAGHRVEPIPGPSAVTAALAAAGLPIRRFEFVGFLPRTTGERRRLLSALASTPATIVAFESPHRLRRSLQDVFLTLGDRRVAVCREMTKVHEEIFRGTVVDAMSRFTEPLGEFTIVIEGATDHVSTAARGVDIDAELRERRTQGKRARDAVREVVALSGQSRQAVYRRWLALGGE
jgi:16S rRNA (cytidine1402-2'-O)-methyltransferase